MACYESCVDLGQRWSLSKHKIYCISCGGFKPHYNYNLLSENTVKPSEEKPVTPAKPHCNYNLLSENTVKPPEEKLVTSVKPQYNNKLLSEITVKPPEEKPVTPVKTEGVEKKDELTDKKVLVPYFTYNECNCKQTCWQWILSFLGFGDKPANCCKRLPLTIWDRGEIARTVLVSKVEKVVQHIKSQTGKPQVVRRTSQINVQELLIEVEQTPIVVDVSSKRNEYLKKYKDEVFISDSAVSFDVDSHHEYTKPEIKHKHKKHKRKKSGVTPRGSDDIRRSRLLSAVANLKARSKVTTISKSDSSSSSEGGVKEEKDSSSLFNPFKNRSFVRNCSCARKFRSLYCPLLPCVIRRRSRRRKGHLSSSKETESSKVVVQSSPKDQPSKKHRVCKQLQPVNRCATVSDKSPCSTQKSSEHPCKNIKRDHKVVQSSSMPCTTCTSCFGSSKPFKSRFCRCDPDLTCGNPKLPCRSESFHSTLMRSPSPLAVVMPQISPCCRPCAVSTGRPRCRRFKCSCPLDCITRRSRSCSRPSCCCPIKSSYCSPPPLCKSGRERSSGPCVDKKSPCNLDCCHLGSKPPISMCPPCCTKPCCLPCPRKFTVFPYCQRIDATSKRYLSIPPCTMRAACPCPVGGPCSCPKAKHFPLPCCPYSPSPTCRVACSTPSAMSYIKSKQNDAICQRLLSKYGFSPPLCQNCPTPCYGNVAEGLCGNMTPSCTSNFYSCAGTGSGGCRSCLP